MHFPFLYFQVNSRWHSIRLPFWKPRQLPPLTDFKGSYHFYLLNLRVSDSDSRALIPLLLTFHLSLKSHLGIKSNHGSLWFYDGLNLRLFLDVYGNEHSIDLCVGELVFVCLCTNILKDACGILQYLEEITQSACILLSFLAHPFILQYDHLVICMPKIYVCQFGKIISPLLAFMSHC